MHRKLEKARVEKTEMVESREREEKREKRKNAAGEQALLLSEEERFHC